METVKIWDNVPGLCEEIPMLEYYKSATRKSNGTVIIFPGGGYAARAGHEGKSYAEYLNSIGIDAFVLQYRVSPHRFPLPLLDARRAIRFVRYNAEKYGLNPEKIAVMGSSAGGHLAALVSTYNGEIDFEKQDDIDKTDYKPNLQILAYPVIALSDLSICHGGSVNGLIDNNLHLAASLNPLLIADKSTPKAFIWHTSNDNCVDVRNSLQYGEKLRSLGIQFEMHIFPDGAHGLGLAPMFLHIAQWTELLNNWLKVNSFFE